MRLQGKCALVTGGANGIGRAIAQRLAAEGARVAILDLDATAGEALAAGLPAGSAVFLPADVTDEAQVTAAVARAEAEVGPTDILVNNAGTWEPGRVDQISLAVWRRMIETNITSMFLVTRAVAPGMMARRSGSIINIASVAGVVGAPEAVAYTASKGAVVNMTRSLALDYAPFGIRANCICPGMTDTAMGDRVVAHYRPGEDPAVCKADWQPLKIAGTPADVAGLAAYLAADESRFMTGSVLLIDGGLSAG